MKASARAGANIAFVKYWGQADADLNLPLNNSISLTLDNAHTVTTVEFVPGLAADTLLLNGAPAGPAALGRAVRHLDRLRALAGERDPAFMDLRARIASRNSFPTGAGIASSASGFAALTLAAAAALDLYREDGGPSLSRAELSALARLASGSACRSLYGGYVEWLAAAQPPDSRTGSGRPPAWATSYAVQLAPPEHWPLVDIVAVVSAGEKDVPSESGHRLAATSPFLPARLATLDAALAACRGAILARDLTALGEVAEADALSLHAVALTSRPSIWYWACGTQAVLDALRDWRRAGLPAYFTIDAGPNVHILTLPAYLPAVLDRLAALPAVEEVITCGPGAEARLLDRHLF